MKEVFDSIIDKLEDLHAKYINQYGIVGSNPGAMAVSRCIRTVEEVQEEYNGGWIPCSELPEENGMYLCTVFHEDDYVVWIMRFNDGEFLKPDDVEDWNYELLAWMPIVPYQPKGE